MEDDRTADAQREDLELEEAERAVVAEGFEARFSSAGDGSARCSNCGTVLPLDSAALVDGHAARDTPTARTGLLVAALRCSSCATLGHAVFGVEQWQPAEDRAAADETATDTTTTTAADSANGGRSDHLSVNADVGKSDAHPLGRDRQHLVPVRDGDTRSLRQRGPLLDEDGADIREYTGEPVETDEGTVIPQQQNVGPGNAAGGGEWPDPRTPPSQ